MNEFHWAEDCHAIWWSSVPGFVSLLPVSIVRRHGDRLDEKLRSEYAERYE